MNHHAKSYYRAAALLLCFCLVAMGNADVYALCLSQSHPGGSGIHPICSSGIHHVKHMPSAERQGDLQKCDTGQVSNESCCIHILLTDPAQNIQANITVQPPAVIDSGAFLNADAMAFIFTRSPAAASLLPAPSPPVILQTQTFLN